MITWMKNEFWNGYNKFEKIFRILCAVLDYFVAYVVSVCSRAGIESGNKRIESRSADNTHGSGKDGEICVVNGGGVRKI